MNYWEKREAFKRLENEGVEVQVAEYPGWRFRVRQLGAWNPHYARALARVGQRPEAKALVERENRAGYVATADDQQLNEDMMRDAFAEGCIAGWQGVTDRDGAPLPFTPAAAAELLEHFGDIHRALRGAAMNAANFDPLSEAEKARLAAGNSGRVSASFSGRGATSSPRLPGAKNGSPARRAKS